MPRALKVYTELFEFDSAIRTEYPVFCGIDEAGRGPLAGDVYAAAVILPEGLEIAGLNDSKQLSEKRREELAPIIKEQAAAWCIASASVAEIEALNILQAALLAMQRAVAGLKTQPVFAITDGNQAPVLPMPVQTVIGGDAKSASIAAASVLAKVARDRYMTEMAEKYPQYAFEKHKGYGTKLHYQMLDEHGASAIHRKSFLKKYYDKKESGQQ
ncbi:MAG: ribonuclease HII [Oscillospiraceae bacterium]|nr:ribonuclease HII [Oscillospiraceae bacterium]